jgi:hypothetical protein
MEEGHERPLYEGLNHEGQWSDEDIEGMLGFGQDELKPVVVYLTPFKCWSCGAWTTAFHVAVGSEERGYVEMTPEAYWPEVIEAIDRGRAGTPMKWKGTTSVLERCGTVKPRYSKKVGHSYVSQGCAQCDAIIGSFYLHEDFVGGDLELLPHFEIDWPPEALVREAKRRGIERPVSEEEEAAGRALQKLVDAGVRVVRLEDGEGK